MWERQVSVKVLQQRGGEVSFDPSAKSTKGEM